MSAMATDLKRDPDLEWLDHVQPVGLVVAPSLLKELGLSPLRQSPIDTGAVAEVLAPDSSKRTLSDPWAFAEKILGWEARHVAGAPGGPTLPDELLVSLPEHATTLQPTWAVAELGDGEQRWQLLVRVEAAGIDPDARSALDGWEATPHQRFERLLRDTGVYAGLLITDTAVRLIYAPSGETSGHLTFPIRPLGTVAGRPMLGGLKLLLDRSSLFTAADSHRLPALLKKSRDAQASVSSALAEQVLGALHELLRGLDSADPSLIRELARSNPDHLYEGLLSVLMRLVFVLYAEDRDLLPSRSDGRAREIYETSYSVRGLYATLVEDAALNPDTMDERRGGWGRLLALFRLIHKGHRTGFVQARGGKLFDPDEFPFLEGRATKDEPGRILTVSDGCLLRVLEGLMTLKVRGGDRERLSYRALDVEQIGSVYETVMGFTVEAASGRVLAIKAGKNNHTPVFVDLDELLAKKGKDRIKDLKEDAGRGQVPAAPTKAIETASSADELAAALDSIVDERGSPRHAIAPAGSPLLQPTDERRRTGSHYTPRSLTAPIVKHALEPAFERLGEDATAEQVLDLKVCDPAMGSGAFLVEACRMIGERLVEAWDRWPNTRPTIPADEDEELHARRLVAQRCLYGVDKNPRAVDLARLSLWLATLARDHEFTFLDHALKCGDSLVGLTREQITSLHWDRSGGLPLFGSLVRERFEAAVNGRREIREAPDDVTRAIQEVRFRQVESRLDNVRLIANAVVAAFFTADKPRAREAKRQEIESWANGPTAEMWPKLEKLARTLGAGGHPIVPFHWQMEFPEVFAHENGGFDAIVGNPPYLGGTKISQAYSVAYFAWLGNNILSNGDKADLIAYFFRRIFEILRDGGVAGIVATSSIAEGDTRKAALVWVRQNGGQIFRAFKKDPWPGEASVDISRIHVAKGFHVHPCILEGKEIPEIDSFLNAGSLDHEPARLKANAGNCFEGFVPYGEGFVIDDDSDRASSTAEIGDILDREPQSAEVIFPYLGGEEVTEDPKISPSRQVIYLAQMPEDEVRERYPAIYSLLEQKVRPYRMSKSARVSKSPWWQFLWSRPRLYKKMQGIERVIVTSRVSKYHAFVKVPSNVIPSTRLSVITFPGNGAYAVIQSRAHELWARYFGASRGVTANYSPSDCFENFPFPLGFQTSLALETVGDAYHAFRAKLMVERNVGLTEIYNSFHARGDNAPDIARLRALHAEMDAAVLCAYEWDDLADHAAAEFIEQDGDGSKTPKTRLDWPAEFKDEVLARLLALNAERADAERAAGLVAVHEDSEDEIGEETEAEEA